ncbi:hypothetical protein K431DRAFT_299713 [Polychaeton citri CBS 116435]|uniref:Uncharacterized protein n=1 Tax=Polychaeton citri CBS 116435 TaxID=1314669 RepID=A0A9P4UVB5_9PEZI|nr:hypothetical protein K431DRAFT_299713 [Polychaeton citri CBS 116435]
MQNIKSIMVDQKFNTKNEAGNLIRSNVDIAALRCYNYGASTELPRELMTEGSWSKTLTSEISYVGYSVPGTAASAAVIDWMVENKSVDTPVPLSLAYVVNKLSSSPSLADNVHVIATAKGIGLRPYPADLILNTVHSIRHDSHMTAQEFKMIWELLPIDKAVNWQLEQMMLNDDEMHAAFEIETGKKSVRHGDWLNAHKHNN